MVQREEEGADFADATVTLARPGGEERLTLDEEFRSALALAAAADAEDALEEDAEDELDDARDAAAAAAAAALSRLRDVSAAAAKTDEDATDVTGETGEGDCELELLLPPSELVEFAAAAAAAKAGLSELYQAA